MSIMKNMKIITISLICLLFISCEKKPSMPSITTTDVTEITLTTARSGGIVSDEGTSPVTTRGICWSIADKPTTADKTSNGANTGSIGDFTCDISDLLPNTKYYVRAYATNGTGSAYGNQVTFITNQIPVPILTTAEPVFWSHFGIRTGGNITNDNEAAVTEKGICWGKSHNPTISDNKAKNVDGGTGVIINYFGFLMPNTTWYIRAYATNISGTGYGNEVSITIPWNTPAFNAGVTYGTVSDIDNNIYKTVHIGSQIWMAENLRTTKFTDGTLIPNITTDAAWQAMTSPAYCIVNNEEGFIPIIGAIYNFYTVSAGKLCPIGWHVPTQTEVTTLEYSLGGVTLAAGKMKEAGTGHWRNPNVDGTNESGFTALPASGRQKEGYFDPGADSYCCWWVSNSQDPYGIYFGMTNESGRLQNYGSGQTKSTGMSVRCLKD
jgi:uncharacterized protein (TIGR02145 family)